MEFDRRKKLDSFPSPFHFLKKKQKQTQKIQFAIRQKKKIRFKKKSIGD